MDVLQVTLINSIVANIINGIVQCLVALFTNAKNPFVIVKEWIFDLIYGKPIEYFEHIAGNNRAYIFVIHYEIMKYIEETLKIEAKCYKYNHDKETTDPCTEYFGNRMINVTYTCELPNPASPQYFFRLSFKSRMHSKNDFLDLVETLKKKSYNNIRSNVYAMKKPNEDNSYQFYPRRDTKKHQIHRSVTKSIIKKMVDGKARNFLLHGPPGTGKTTIITQVADHYKACVFISRLSDFKNVFELYKFFLAKIYKGTDDNDENIWCEPETKIFIFEDFNTTMPAEFWTGRGEENKTMTAQNIVIATDKTQPQDKEKLTYSDLLNILDGVIPMEGVYTFWTTNHIEDINPSFIRNGRMNSIFIDKIETAEAAIILDMTEKEVNARYPDGIRICDIN